MLPTNSVLSFAKHSGFPPFFKATQIFTKIEVIKSFSPSVCRYVIQILSFCDSNYIFNEKLQFL